MSLFFPRRLIVNNVRHRGSTVKSILVGKTSGAAAAHRNWVAKIIEPILINILLQRFAVTQLLQAVPVVGTE